MRGLTWGLVAVLVAACGPADPDPTDPTDSDADTETGVTSDTDTDTVVALAFDAGPAIVRNPNERAPLVQILTATTTVPTRLEVLITGGAGPRTLTFETPTKSHDVALLGMRAGGAYTVEVTAIDEGGERITADPIAVQQVGLPPQFPEFDVTIADTSRMEPGYTLFIEHGTNLPDANVYLIILDPQGEVVWYNDTRLGSPAEAHMTPEGNLRILSSGRYDRTGTIVEIDMRGELVKRYRGSSTATDGDIVLPVDYVHHDVHPAPNGGLFYISVEAHPQTPFPTSDTNPSAPMAPVTVMADVVVEMGPDGTLLASWSMWDLLDRTRIGYDSLQSKHWVADFGTDAKDWLHANAVFYDAADDALLLSLRHQDAVVKFSRATGELIWILGPNANWAPEFAPYLLERPADDFMWPYHQHAVEVTPSGTILVFDNGNNRASAFEQKLPHAVNLSRPVEYRVDETAMTVEQVWRVGDVTNRRPYAYMVGDADHQPQTGNVLTLWGAIGPDGADVVTWELVEHTHTDPPEEVFKVVSSADRSWIPVYRAERIPDLYP